MVNLQDQILLNINANNNASNAARQIDRDFQSMASNITSAISSLNSGMMSVSAVTDNLMQGLTGKSALDNIFATTTKAETNKVLIGMMTDTEEAADSLFKTVDDVTNESLTSMQDLIPAMNAFSSATGASDKELESVTDEMANFGAAVLAQTGSTDLAQQAMMDLSKGIKGAFASLDQYGVSEDALKRTGLWDGKEDDVEGYMAAVEKVIGSTDELMETNQGLDALIGKAFSRGGKKIGNEFLPFIKDIKKGFIDLDNELGGNLTASMLAVSGGVEVMNQGLWNISTTVQGVKDLSEGLHTVWDMAKGAKDAISGLNSASQGVGDALSIGADMVDVAPTTQYMAGATDLIPNDMLGNFVEASNLNVSKDELTKAEKLLGSNDKELLKFGKLMEQHNNALDDAMETLKQTGDFSKYERDVKKINKDKDNLFRYIEEFGEVSSLSDGVLDGIDVVDDVGDSLKSADKVGDAVKEVSEVGTAMGAAGTEMAASSVAIEETAVATTSLSASFTSMIVPLLAISAVIAIMIPIAAGLAAEALIFLKGIQMLFDALDFGGIDLSDDISGIKQLAEGIAWIGVAMAAMTFTSIMTGLAVITSGVLGITGPLSIAIDALNEAAGLLQQFSGIKIDSNIPKNIKRISDSLTSVSDAMMALTSLNITTGFSNFVAWALHFDSVTSALDQAKNDLINASNAINNLADSITPLDEDKAKNIQNVCDSLASVGDAFSALTSMRDSVNWDNYIGSFFNGVDIKTALDSVKQDITDASEALSGFDNLSKVPKGVGETIKSVADTLTSVSDAFKTLRTLRDDVNWDDFIGGIFQGQNIQQALSDVKKEIFYAWTELKGFEGIPALSENIPATIKSVTDSVGSVGEAVKGLTSLPDMGDYDTTQISTAVTNIQNAATELSKLDETTFSGETANGVLSSISTTIENLKTTLSGASGFTEPAMNIGTQIINGVQSGIAPLASTVQTEVTSATNSAASNGWTGGSYIGTSVNGGFKSALDLHTIMTTEMGYVKTAVDNGISAAKTAAQNGAEDIVEAFKTGINVGSPGDIARAMKQEMIYTKDFISGATSNLKVAAYNTAKAIVDAFGNPSLTVDSLFTNTPSSYIGSLETTVSRAPDHQDKRTVVINIHEGAVTVDARNKTESEAKGILTLALEGMDHITNVDVDGV